MTGEGVGEAGSRYLIDPARCREIAEGVFCILGTAERVVPNVGIVLGHRAALVIDTGLGRTNGRRTLEVARSLAADRKLFLVTTHLHPEHALGAQGFAEEATFICNRVQRDELAGKGHWMVTALQGGGRPEIAELVADLEVTLPHVVYEGEAELDLGGRTVQLRHFWPGHTAGDEIVFLAAEGILFAGDLVLNGYFPAFAPGDPDVSSSGWSRVLEALEQLEPATVVPGHGDVSDTAAVVAMREFIADLRSRVAGARSSGRNVEEFRTGIASSLEADYADWGEIAGLTFAVESVDRELAAGTEPQR